MSAEREPSSRLDALGAYMMVCVFLGGAGGAGEIWACIARHLMSPENVFGAAGITFAGITAGAVVGALSLVTGGKRQ